jgi:hypothetical protein
VSCYSTVSLVSVRGGNSTTDVSDTRDDTDGGVIALLPDPDQDPNEQNVLEHRRQLQSPRSTPLFGFAIQTSVFETALQEVALYNVNQIDTSSVFGEGLTFEFPATNNFVFGVEQEPPEITPFTEDSIVTSIVQDTDSPDDSFLIKIGISDLEAKFPNIVIQATGTITVPQPVTIECFLTWTNLIVSLPLPSGINVVIKTSTTGSTISTAVEETTVTVDDLSIPLVGSYVITGDASCSEFKTEFDTAVQSAEETIVQQAKDLLTNSFGNSFSTQFGNPTIDIGSPLGIGAGNIELGLAFDIFGVSDDNQRLQIAARANPKATITTIPHREGSYYKPPQYTPNYKAVVPTELDKTLAASFKMKGLNALISSAFYLSWADLTDLTGKSKNRSSKACKAIAGDPCPFPELELIVLEREPEEKPLRYAFLALRRFFRRGGFYESFRISVVLTPPKVTVSNDSIDGSIIASVYIQAKKRYAFEGQLRDMAMLSFPLIFKASVPKITDDGNVENVKLKDLKIGKRNDGLDFDYFQPFPFKPTLRGRIALRWILLPILRRNLYRFRGTIDSSLDGIVSNVVIKTTLEPVEFSNISIQPEISEIAIATSGATSTLTLSTNLQLTI